MLRGPISFGQVLSRAQRAERRAQRAERRGFLRPSPLAPRLPAEPLVDGLDFGADEVHLGQKLFDLHGQLSDYRRALPDPADSGIGGQPAPQPQPFRGIQNRDLAGQPLPRFILVGLDLQQVGRLTTKNLRQAEEKAEIDPLLVGLDAGKA